MRKWLLLAIVCAAAPLAAAYPPQQQNAQWRELVLNLQYEVSNQDAELGMLRERLDNQEQIIDTVRFDSEKLQMLSRELLRNQSESVDGKMAGVEGSHERLKSDLKELQGYASSVKDHLSQYQTRIQALEANVEQQSKNLQTLEVAVRALVDALQGSDKHAVVADASDSIYRVVDGDSLGTIAKKHHTTIRRLKEANNLSSDRIIIGQKLKIPTADAN